MKSRKIDQSDTLKVAPKVAPKVASKTYSKTYSKTVTEKKQYKVRPIKDIPTKIDNLVIVESPGKIQKIRSYLGPGFMVTASIGHIWDLDEKTISVDIDTMTPKYVVPDRSKGTVAGLVKLSLSANNVYIASDDDREGEFIGFSLVSLLHLKKYKRIYFHEITKKAIIEALSKPTNLNENLIHAQQCRRIIDRLIGYMISPILRTKLKNTEELKLIEKQLDKNKYLSISCGRVISVITRMVYDKCLERDEFLLKDTNSYFYTDGEFDHNINGKMCLINIEPLKLSYDIVLKFIKSFLYFTQYYDFIITNKFSKQYTISPSQPYITSSLQQDAYYKYHFNPDLTMLYAQKLYEKGLITYMRTDSPNLSNECIAQIKDYIYKKYGEKYSKVRQFKSKNKGAQEAHEAIRPTNILLLNDDVKELFISDTNVDNIVQLYNLIWCRTIASQMICAINESIYIKIELDINDNFIIKDLLMMPYFISTFTKCIEQGFKMVYSINDNDNDNNDNNNNNNIVSINDEECQLFESLNIGTKLKYNKISSIETISIPKPLYNQSSLIKELEKNGIGRPSTYAPSIKKIFAYNYVTTANVLGFKKDIRTIILQNNNITINTKINTIGGEKQKIIITDLGKLITKHLLNNYPEMMDYDFTSKMEQTLDDIAIGDIKYMDFLNDFKNKLISWL